VFVSKKVVKDEDVIKSRRTKVFVDSPGKFSAPKEGRDGGKEGKRKRSKIGKKVVRKRE